MKTGLSGLHWYYSKQRSKSICQVFWSTRWFKGDDFNPPQQATLLGKDWKKWNRNSYQENFNIFINQEKLISLSSSMDIYCSEMQNLSLYVSSTYMWTHPHWLGVTRTSDNLPAKKPFFGITRISSKSLALNHCAGGIKVRLLRKLIGTLLMFK